MENYSFAETKKTHTSWAEVKIVLNLLSIARLFSLEFLGKGLRLK